MPMMLSYESERHSYADGTQFHLRFRSLTVLFYPLLQSLDHADGLSEETGSRSDQFGMTPRHVFQLLLGVRLAVPRPPRTFGHHR